MHSPSATRNQRVRWATLVPSLFQTFVPSKPSPTRIKPLSTLRLQVKMCLSMADPKVTFGPSSSLHTRHSRILPTWPSSTSSVALIAISICQLVKLPPSCCMCAQSWTILALLWTTFKLSPKFSAPAMRSLCWSCLQTWSSSKVTNAPKIKAKSRPMVVSSCRMLSLTILPRKMSLC